MFASVNLGFNFQIKINVEVIKQHLESSQQIGLAVLLI